MGKWLNQQRGHGSIPTTPHRSQGQCAVLHVGIWLPNEGLDAVVECPNHRIRVDSKAQRCRSALDGQLAVGVCGERYAFFVKEIAHQGLSADVGERGVSPRKRQVSRHKLVAAVLPIATDCQRCFQVGLLVDGLGVGRSQNAHPSAEILVAIVVAVNVALRTQLV